MRLFRVLFLVGFVVVLATSSYATSFFYDDFSGTTLDAAKWKVLNGGNGILVDGELSLCGYGHTRIVSRDDFLYGFLEGDFIFRDQYHKFGFGVNAGEFGYSGGFYFDTLEDKQLHARVYAGNQYLTVYDSGATVMGESLHLGIWWTPSEIRFYRNGDFLQSYSGSFTDPLPIGVFADRTNCLTADNVKVTPEPGTAWLLGAGLLFLLGLGRKIAGRLKARPVAFREGSLFG